MKGVALEGGGARGAYHAGALKALKDKGIDIDGFVGTSIGSINAAFACSGEYNKLIKLWKSATNKELFGLDDKIIDAISKKQINKEVIGYTIKTSAKILKNAGIDTSKFKKILEENISEEKLRDSVNDFGLVTYNISEFKPVEIFKEDIPKGKLIEYLIASSYLPLFKNEKIIDNNHYIDGGIYDNLPIDMLLKKGYKEIYAVRTNAVGRLKKTNIKDEKVIYITPKKKLGNIMVFSPEKNKRNIKLGYYDTLRAIDKLDGYDYYIKNKPISYYEEIFSKVTPYELSKLKREFKTENKKIITIKVLEKIAHDYFIDEFRVYSPAYLILKAKLATKEKDKYYFFIKKLKIKLF